MIIDDVEFFYLAMPEIHLDADGSQDALLVRVSSGDLHGWGECEASPLVSIAAFVTPPSHGVCQPVSASVLGARVDSPADILEIGRMVRRRSMDLLQAAHVFSGIEMALWDLLGRATGQPAWSLLGYSESLPKVPYASILFEEMPEQTYEAARAAVGSGFKAVKFGWGPFGTAGVGADADQVHAARAGVGPDAWLMVDAGQVFEDDVDGARARVAMLEDAGVLWLEEPFGPDSFDKYVELRKSTTTLCLAGGEAAHSSAMANNLVRFGGISFVQIDSGRIGGLGPSKAVADFASHHDVAYVNHTFTSHLALSASMQPFAGLAASVFCEYPAAPRELAAAIAVTPLGIDDQGMLSAPSAPGLGVDVDVEALRAYRRAVDIVVDGLSIYSDDDVSSRLTSPTRRSNP